MRNNNGSFFKHYKRISVEGFEQQRLLTECIKAGIVLRDIHFINDIEMVINIMDADYNVFMKLIKNRYKVTILYEQGYKPLLKKLFGKKSTIVGLILFALLMYYQSSFVSEIRIMGYEKFTEAGVRDSLRRAGLYEGCSKSIDLNQVKLYIYQDLDNIAWIGIKYIGNLAEITIVEGTITPKPVDISKPCHIVASKEGYVDRIIAKEGKINLNVGSYVNKGDILINGIVPIQSTAYGTIESAITERYVHADGEVFAKVPYRLTYYQNRYDLIRTPTGKSIYGIRIGIGNFGFDSARWLNRFESANYIEREVIDTVRPIPIAFSLVKIEEVTLSRKERTEDQIKKASETLVRNSIKEKIPENAQILNKDLMFSPRENIIKVAVTLETLEEIGEKKEIIIGEPAN